MNVLTAHRLSIGDHGYVVVQRGGGLFVCAVQKVLIRVKTMWFELIGRSEEIVTMEITDVILGHQKIEEVRLCRSQLSDDDWSSLEELSQRCGDARRELTVVPNELREARRLVEEARARRSSVDAGDKFKRDGLDNHLDHREKHG